MAKYERIVTTAAGLELLENAAYMAGAIQFTALKAGSGTYDGTEDLESMTDLKKVCQAFGIGSVIRKDGNVIVRVVIDNKDLEEGYAMTELGLYATDPESGEAVLYAIILAETGSEDFVPAYADAPTSITFEAYMELTESTEAVRFAALPVEGVYVPAESFNEHVQDEALHVTAEEKENWNGKLDDSGDASNTVVEFAEATELEALTSKSKLSVLFGIVGKAVSSLISHLKDTVSHVTSAERNAWNTKAAGTHSHTKSEITDFPTSMTPTAHNHTKSEITDFPSTMPPSAHNQAASTITAGTFGGKVVANATTVAVLGDAQLRNISIGEATLEAGTTALSTGDIYIKVK